MDSENLYTERMGEDEMITYNNRIINIIKLLQVWRSTFEGKIEGEDWYYNHVNKDRDEDRLLRNLQVNAKDTIDDLFEFGCIPKESDIYEE